MQRVAQAFHKEAHDLITAVRKEFGRINNDKNRITPRDRERLKELYIEEFVVPQARQILDRYYPERPAMPERVRTRYRGSFADEPRELSVREARRAEAAAGASADPAKS